MSTIDPIEYIIRARIEVPNSIPGLTAIGRQVSGIERQISGITGAFLGLGAGVGIGSLIKGFIGLNAEMQNTENGIATLFSSLGRMDFADAMVVARGELSKLRMEANAGVGSLADYTRGFQLLLGAATGAGASIDQVHELNRLAIAAGFASGRGKEGARMAGLDIVQGLSGNVSDRNTPILIRALQAAGLSAEQFKGADPQARIEMLMKAFGTFREAADAMANSWDARTETFSDHIKEIGRNVSRPLFDRWSDQLGTINKWLDSHRAILKDIADNIGQRLVVVFDRLGANSGLLAAAAGTAAAGAVGAKGAGFMTNALGFGGSASKMTGAGTLAGLGGGAAAAIAGLAAAVVGFLVGSIIAAIRRYPSELTREWGATFGGIIKELERFGNAVMGMMSNPYFSEFGLHFGNFVEAFGGGLIILLRTMTMVVEGFGALQTAAYARTKSVWAAMKGDAGGAAMWDSLAVMHAAQGDAVINNRLAHLLDPALDLSDLSKKTTGGDGKLPVANFNYNFNGPVNIKIEAERLDDPNVVAVSFNTLIQRLKDYPVSGRGGRLVPKPR
ncbi:MAG: hypothetical protein ABL912_01880 [Novosphingobium sp.]